VGFSSVPVRQPVPDVPESDFPGAPTPPDAPKHDESFVVHLRLLWEHRRLLVRAVLCGLLAGTLVAFLIPTRYESTARLMPPDSNQGGGLAMAAATLSAGGGGALGSGLGSGLGSIASDMLGLKSTSEIFVGILSSRTVQDKLVQQFDLRKLYGVRRMEDARKKLSERTSIFVDRKSQITTVTVTDHDPKRSAAMGQAYVEELNRLVAELSTSSARRERIFLEQRLQTVSGDLETAEKEFSQYSSKNTAIDIKEQGKAMVEAAAVLQGHLIAAESELEGLRQIYTDNNVRIRAVRARIAELKYQLEKIGGKGEEMSAASGQQTDTLYPSIRKLPLLGVQYADLYRRTKVQEAVFEYLTKEYEMAKVQEVKEIPTVKVLDSPNIPERKSFPPRLLIMFLGSVFAVAMASAWVFGKTAWDQTDENDPGKALAKEVFTTVQASLPKFSRNGTGAESEGRRPWAIWSRSGDAAEDRKDEGSDTR
jgi:capsule polysaccharide export protein KpsE/RkpR